MTLTGNLLLCIAAVFYFLLQNALFGKEPPRAGDAAVGYVWSILIINLVFIICMISVCCIIGSKGSFSWVSSTPSARFFLTAAGLLASLITIATSSLFKYENGPGLGLIKWLASFVPTLLPLVLLVTAFILLNNTIRLQVPVAIYKWPLLLTLVIGIAGTGSALQLFIADSMRNQQAVRQRMIEDDLKNHNRMLSEIDSCDVTKDMVFILVFTDANQDKEVRERAVAKVKTNPEWQQEIIARLKNDWAPEAFNFLASNNVDDPQQFAEPVKEGILIQARLIRESIRKTSHPSHFYQGQFSWEVERVLRTAERFKNMNTDYLPAIKAVRAALDEPSEFEKPVFECRAMLDEWINKHP
jgi:uncharacterized protein YlxP (DUF503 family)